MRDVVGAWLSILCMIHCLLPLMLVSFGASVGAHHVAESMHNEWMHFVLLLPIILLLAFSLPKAYKNHGSKTPAVLAIVGVVTLITAVTVASSIETPVTILGSMLVISSHLMNRRTLRAVVA